MNIPSIDFEYPENSTTFSKADGTGAQILKDMGLAKLRILTNNPRKIVGLEGYGLEVVERVAIQPAPHVYNAKYLKTKKEKLGHDFPL